MIISRIAAWKIRQPEILVKLLSYKTSTMSIRNYIHRKRSAQRQNRRNNQPVTLPFLVEKFQVEKFQLEVVQFSYLKDKNI